MSFIWLSLIILSGGWLSLCGIYTLAQPFGYLFIAIALLLNIFVSRKVIVHSLPRPWYLVCIILFVLGINIPVPYNIGFFLLSAGLLSGLLLPTSSIRSAIVSGLILTGLVLIAQSAFLPFYYLISSHYHSVPLITPIIAALSKLFGLHAYSATNSFFLQTMNNGVTEFTTTIDKLGCFFWFNLVIGSRIIIWYFPSRKRLPFSFVLLFPELLFLLVRFIGMTLLYSECLKISIFWQPLLTFATFIPMAIVYHAFMHGRISIQKDLKFRKVSFSPRIAWGMACLFGATVFLVSAGLFHDPGIPKTRRILLDEAHSNWEWTTKKFDTIWYGEKSGYNYYCLFDYLSHFFDIKRNFKQLTPELLGQCDILIIKTPTARFSQEELLAIHDFVKNGGGLFLIGDHTNVFGTSAYLNPIADMFGMHYNFDATYDLPTGGLQLYTPPKFFRHPAIQHLPPFLFGTSCSLHAPLFSENVITGSRLISALRDYSERSFFSHKTDVPTIDFGIFLQCAAIKCGKGRVLAFTDSTVFSNFWMFIPGKPELFMGCITWLDRRNCFAFFNLVFLLCAIPLIGFSWRMFSSGNTPRAIVFPLLSILPAVPLTILILSNLDRVFYQCPQPQTKPVYVCFEKEHSDFDLPIIKLLGSESRTFHTFYVWVQRLGFVPQVQPSFHSAMDGDVVVFINPKKHFDAQERSEFFQYIENGGKALFIDNSKNIGSTSNDLLSMAGLTINPKSLGNESIHDTAMNEIATTIDAASLEGGEPLLRTTSGKSVMGFCRKGQGEIMVMTDSQLFSDVCMGTTSTVPNDNQRKIYNLEFQTFTRLIEK